MLKGGSSTSAQVVVGFGPPHRGTVVGEEQVGGDRRPTREGSSARSRSASSPKVTPYRVILFDSTGAWRIAQVADDARITSGGRTLTLGQFAKLLQSNDPADINLVNGFYRVTVRQGLVTTLRKSTS